MTPTLPAKTHKLRWLREFGPGLITGASDDDPSGIATYSQAGAQLGFGLSWVTVLTYPLMDAIQEISARIALRAVGWIATLVMAAAAVVLVLTTFLNC